MLAANVGYPRIGAKRELKRALESFWAGKLTEADLVDVGRRLRLTHWQLQRDAGIDVIPSNDFSFYDQMLDMTVTIGAIPTRYSAIDQVSSMQTYFAMARGIQHDGFDIPAMEMTKWFDTNYHYIVPEIEPGQSFHFASKKIVDEFLEARQAGIETRPVLIGPVTYLMLSKSVTSTTLSRDNDAYASATSPLDALPALLPVYAEILRRLAEAGADWVQIDEPYLVFDLDDATRAAYTSAYAQLGQSPGIRILLATYFGALEDNLGLALALPVAGVHVDVVRAPEQLDDVLARFPAEMVLSVGIVDGRNVWRADLDAALARVQRAVDALGKDRVHVAASCSLLFSPHDLDLETALDADLRSWLAFARQKIDEIVSLKRALNEGVESVAPAFTISRAAVSSRKQSPRTNNPGVRARLAAIEESALRRTSHNAVRKPRQANALVLPTLPTTTIGSFPQTAEVRAQRASHNKGTLSAADYRAFLRAEIERAIRLQEEIGLDVLVHGEFERTDMVEYFGEQLTGIAFTQHGWVQSYGSRAVRPPIIFGDVARPAPMTVEWSVYAQSLTDRSVKGMLTGPVTILEWSFVRDDQPRAETCQQIALAIRDEVLDLESAGLRIIQIDEPALREGLPLRLAHQARYLGWAVDCFRLATAGVRDETQIHTHMCYAEFNDILEAIARMDADVISIEASRSNLELLDDFRRYAYPNDIGPGVYDIHSPRVPSEQDIESLLHKAAQVLRVDQLWVNLDCGLKTRGWDEVIPALRHMVNAARNVRETLAVR